MLRTWVTVDSYNGFRKEANYALERDLCYVTKSKIRNGCP